MTATIRTMDLTSRVPFTVKRDGFSTSCVLSEVEISQKARKKSMGVISLFFGSLHTHGQARRVCLCGRDLQLQSGNTTILWVVIENESIVIHVRIAAYIFSVH